jgi:hypothetical protein
VILVVKEQVVWVTFLLMLGLIHVIARAKGNSILFEVVLDWKVLLEREDARRRTATRYVALCILNSYEGITVEFWRLSLSGWRAAALIVLSNLFDYWVSIGTEWVLILAYL